MSDRTKIDCEKAEDRDALVTILARNSYTVRQGRERKGPNTRYSYYIEFWKEDTKAT